MRVLKSGFLFAAVVSLSGCIVVPYEAPQGTVGPRTDVPAAVPDSIVKGKTTRAEVLAVEGKPDGEGSDWFVYSATAKESGLGLFFCFATKDTAGCGDARRQVWDYRRLVVRFDAVGVVSDVHADSASCLRWTGDFQPPVPCLDLLGGDLRRADTLATLQGKQVLTTYESVRWPADQENDCTFYGKLVVAQDALYFVAGPASPLDMRMGLVDPARCPEPDGAVAFDDAEIADLALVKGMSGDQAIKLSRKDGSHLTFQFYAKSEDEDEKTAHAIEVADDIKKVTGRTPDSFGGLSTAADGGARTYEHVRWCSGWNPPPLSRLSKGRSPVSARRVATSS